MMRKETRKKRLLHYAVALVLAVTLVIGNMLPVCAAAIDATTNEYGDYLQKVALYSMLGDDERGLEYFDQEIQKDSGNLDLYLARAQMRQVAGDLAGAKQDCDYAISHLTDNTSENTGVRIYGYTTRASISFFQGNQAQYLADMQANQDFMDKLFSMSYAYPVEEDGQSWQEMKAQDDAQRNELRNWYNNGNPAKSFQTKHSSVNGGIGDTTIQINEAWDEDGIDTTYETTFHLSQPVRNITRKAPIAYDIFYSVLDSNDIESGAVAYFVPVGTVVTMDQIFQSGKSRAKTYHTFSAENIIGGKLFDGETLTVEAGKVYALDYADTNSLRVYFIAG